MPDSVVEAVFKDSSKDSLRAKVDRACAGTMVKPDSVRKRIQRRKVEKDRAHGNQLLSDTEELVIVGTVRALASAGTPLIRSQIIDLTRQVFIKGVFSFPSHPVFVPSSLSRLSSRPEMERRLLVLHILTSMGRYHRLSSSESHGRQESPIWKDGRV